MEPVTAQMPDVVLVWMCLVTVALIIGFVAHITKEDRHGQPRRRSFEDAYLDKLSNTDF